MQGEPKKSLKKRLLLIVLFSFLFSALTGAFFAVMCALFVPVVFPDWAGKYVCEGKMVFMSLQRTYFCYTSTTVFYELGSTVFRTMLKMFLAPCIGICFVLFTAFFGATDFVLGADRED